MKFKVTVELEEGIRYTRTGTISSERVILSLRDQLNKEFQTQHTQCTELSKIMIESAGELGRAAMTGIIKVLSEHGMLFHCNRRLSEYDKNGDACFKREIHVIKDINEFLELKKKLDKDELIKE